MRERVMVAVEATGYRLEVDESATAAWKESEPHLDDVVLLRVPEAESQEYPTAGSIMDSWRIVIFEEAHVFSYLLVDDGEPIQPISEFRTPEDALHAAVRDLCDPICLGGVQLLLNKVFPNQLPSS